MANFHQEDVLVINDNYKCDFRGDDLLGPCGQEEPIDLDKGIQDQEESVDPAEEESNQLGWGPNIIFEQDIQPHLLSPPDTGCHSFLWLSTLQPWR